MKPIFMTYTRGDLINLAVLLIVGVVIIPMTVSSGYWYTSILIPWLCLALATIGQQIIMGYTGQLALGAAGFMAAGAFACFNLILRVPGIPFVGALLISGLIAAAFGILFGLPSLRVRGIYLMVATLASQFFIIWMIDKFGWFKNYDSSGIITAQDIVIMGKPFTSPIEMYLVIVAVVTPMTLIAMNMARGSTGRNWMSVRDMDIAAEIIGVNPLKAKLSAFAISSFFVGISGALYFSVYLGAVEVGEVFGINKSFLVLFMIIIGGLGSVFGSFAGAAFLVLLPVLLKNVLVGYFGWQTDVAAHLEFMIIGGLIVWFLIVEPHGLAQLWRLGKEKLRTWPFPY